MPDHVKHPDRYRCYGRSLHQKPTVANHTAPRLSHASSTQNACSLLLPPPAVLDEPLVVGGGVGQLAGEQGNVRQAWGAPEAAGEEAEPERWEGPVGVAGAVQFRPRKQRDESGAAAEGSSVAAMDAAAGKKAAQPAVAAAFDDEGVEEEGGEDAAMPDAEPQPKGKQRHYRTSRRTSDD